LFFVWPSFGLFFSPFFATFMAIAASMCFMVPGTHGREFLSPVYGSRHLWYRFHFPAGMMSRPLGRGHCPSSVKSSRHGSLHSCLSRLGFLGRVESRHPLSHRGVRYFWLLLAVGGSLKVLGGLICSWFPAPVHVFGFHQGDRVRIGGDPGGLLTHCSKSPCQAIWMRGMALQRKIIASWA
jgi:hypothetical protein